VLETTLTFHPTQFEVARDDVRISGTIVDIDPQTGRATGIQRVTVWADPATGPRPGPPLEVQITP
jgi:2',3'-cyclic-nucleotide 2'-phosphodiesterase